MAHLEQTQNIGNPSRLGLPNEVVEKGLNKALKIIVERRGIDYIDDYDRDQRLQIAEFFSQSSVHQGLLLFGSWGTGKSSMLKAIARAMTDFYAAMPSPFNGLEAYRFNALRMSVYDFKSPIIDERLFMEACDTPLLLLDDVGLENGCPETQRFSRELIGEVLLKRYDRMKPTVLASIFDIESLSDIYGRHVAEIMKEVYATITMETSYRNFIVDDPKIKFHRYEPKIRTYRNR